MSYAGLGQTPATEMVTFAPRSADLIYIQDYLIRQRLLSLSRPDGVISSTSSPTLAAVRNFATNNGLSATGTARTPSGGITLPRRVFEAMSDMVIAPEEAPPASAPPATTPLSIGNRSTTGGETPRTGGSIQPGGRVREDLAPPAPATSTRTLLIVGGVGAAAVLLIAILAATRSRPAAIQANRRRRR